MINPQWLELPMSRTNFHGPKDVRATEVRLYMFFLKLSEGLHYMSANSKTSDEVALMRRLPKPEPLLVDCVIITQTCAGTYLEN